MDFYSVTSFQHNEIENGKVVRSHILNVMDTDCKTWMELVKEYAQFLSGIYGYDIVEQIEVKGGPLNEYP